MLCTIPLASHRALYGNQQSRDSKLLQAVGFRVRNWQQQNPETCLPWDLNLFNDHELFTLRKLDQSDDEDFNLSQQGNLEARVLDFAVCFWKNLSIFGWLYTWSFLRWCGFPARTNVDMGYKNLESRKKSETCGELRCWICNQPPIRFQSSFQLLDSWLATQKN